MNEQQIKNIAVDILCITTMWGLLNNPYGRDTIKTIIGGGISIYAIMKYL